MNDELMTLDRFWELVEFAFEESGGDHESQREELADALRKVSPEELAAFQEHLHARIDEAYTWDLWAAASIVNAGCTDDDFLFFRAWLVSRGREAYEAAVDDPNSLLDIDLEGDSDGCTFEDFLCVASDVYEELTDRMLDARGFRTPLEEEPEGEPLEETPEDLANRLPALWAAHGW